MLSVEDWAEIRRLHRSEGMPIKVVARVMGCSKNTVKRALAAEGPPRLPAAATWLDCRRGRAAGPGAAAGVADDAGHGDRGADRLGSLDPGVAGPGGRAASGLPAAGPGFADRLCRGGGRPVRSVVPRHPAAGRVRPVPRPDPAAGAGDGDRVCPVAVGPAASLPRGGGSAGRLVGAAPGAGGGAAGAGLGRRGSDRAVAAWPQRADRGHPGVPRHPGHQGGDLPSG